MDLSQTARDLTSCDAVPGNLVGNPGFEEPSPGVPDGNGRATNHGIPPSTISGGVLGPWDGCCDQPVGGTIWTVRSALPHCGTRAVFIASDRAADNVLNQRLDLAAYGGQAFVASAWVQVSAADSGAQLGLDVFDLLSGQIVASSLWQSGPTTDWRLLTARGQVPTGGALQLRIKSRGTLTATVDDTSLVPQ
jgi:hypothetical protein